MKENHINLETKITSRLAELEPIFANNFAEHDKNKKKIEFIKSHTNEINGKMKEILESISLMKKSIEEIQKNIRKVKTLIKITIKNPKLRNFLFSVT